MKITFDTIDLKIAVKSLEKTNKSKLNPYIRIRSNENGLILGTSDLACTTEIFLGGDLENADKVDFQVDRDVFIGLVKMAKGSEISLEKREKYLFFKSGEYTAKIPFSVEITKYFEIEKEGVRMDLSLKDVLKGLNKVAYSASFNYNDVQLSGIVWSFDKSGITFVGADGFRMAYSKIDNDTGIDNIVFMTPIFNIETFKSLAKDVEDPEMVLYYTNRSVILETEEFTMAMRLNSAEVYAFKSILATKCKECKVLTSRKALIDMFSFVNVISSNSIEGEKPIFIRAAKDSLEASVSGETGVSNNKIESDVKGEFRPENIGFYPSNVLDVLKRAEGVDIVIEFGEKNMPIIFYEPTEDVIEWKAYIMPVQMRS